MKKQYDYWLIIWTTHDGEEIHAPMCFQVGVHPKEYCESALQSEFKMTGPAFKNQGKKIKDHYKSYELNRLLVDQVRN